MEESARVLGQARASLVSGPSAGTLSEHGASSPHPRFCVSSIQHGDSTCMRRRGTRAQGLHGAGPGKAVRARPRVCFTPLQAARSQGLSSKPRLLTPPGPTQKWAVKERGTGLACCSWAICSSQKGAVGPKAPESPELVAVVLNDDLYSVVPQLSSKQQVLVFEIFHLLSKHIIVQLQLVKPLQLLRQPVVALSKLLDIITGFGENPTFTLARLGALHGAVRDDLGQLHNPIVDLVSAAALDFIMLSPAFLIPSGPRSF